jgi:cobalt-zinc-cadmium efflux system protein
MAEPHDHRHDHTHDDHQDHGDDHGHGHDHGHGQHHHHHHIPGPGDHTLAFAVGVGLNTAFVVAEVVAGLWAGSLALLADAGHNLSDVLALVLAWGASSLAKRAPEGQRTYGLRKGTILASLANAVLLLVAVGAIVAESIRRLGHPGDVQTGTVMLIAGLGILINGVTAAFFFRGSHGDLNLRGAFLHMAADAAVSAAVVVGALIMAKTGLAWIDPVLGLGISAVIVIGSWALLKESMDLALDAAPKEIDVAEVRGWLAGQPGVTEVHDLHIWAMSTTETALTAHVVRPQNGDADQFLHALADGLAQRFAIGHATVQVETSHAQACRLAPAEVV